jgi:hypothetical protein
MINEEKIEDEQPVLEEAPISARDKKEKEAVLKPTARRTNASNTLAPSANMAKNLAITIPTEKASENRAAKKEAPLKREVKVVRHENPSSKAEREKRLAVADKRPLVTSKNQYNGPFSKAHIPKKTVDLKPEVTKKEVPQMPALCYNMMDSLEIKKLSSYHKDMDEKDSVRPVLKVLESLKTPVSQFKSKKNKKSPAKFSKFECESSEDGPPIIPLTEKEDFDDENELELDDLENSLRESQEFSLPLCSKDEQQKPQDMQESLNLDKIEFSQDLNRSEVEEIGSPKENIFDLGKFDDEVTGEIIDPSEKKLKLSDGEKIGVSVFSDNIADAVLNIDEDRKTLSSEEGSADPFSESEFRTSLKSSTTEIPMIASANIMVPVSQFAPANSSGGTFNQQIQLPPSSQSTTMKMSSSNLNLLDKAMTPMTHGTRKSSISQYSCNEQQESPPHTIAQSQTLYSQYQMSNNSFTSQVQPELVKKVSKTKVSNTTSSVVSRDSSTKQSHMGSSSHIRRLSNSVVNQKGMQASSSTSTMMSKSVCQTLEELTKKCKGKNNQLVVLYCSILLLSKRAKEAVKEINYFFSLAFLNHDYQLISHMARLKAIILISQKKFEDACSFLTLYKDLSTQLGSDLGIAIANFGLGYCKLNQNDLTKAKIHFTESQKRYITFDHLFGRLYSIRHLLKIFMKEKKEKEIKELHEKLKILNVGQNHKDYLKKSFEHKKGIFISRKGSEILSILIEFDSEYREIKEKEGFNIKKILQNAAVLMEQYCKQQL